jgi:hypothetical protein
MFLRTTTYADIAIIILLSGINVTIFGIKIGDFLDICLDKRL